MSTSDKTQSPTKFSPQWTIFLTWLLDTIRKGPAKCGPKIVCASFGSHVLCMYIYIARSAPSTGSLWPMASVAQKTMATFGHCGIWTYDLPPDFNWGKKWMEWSVKSLPFWELVGGLVSIFDSHLNGMMVPNYFDVAKT